MLVRLALGLAALCAASAQQQRLLPEDGGAQLVVANRPADQVGGCPKLCRENEAANKDAPTKSCETGCRLMAIIETVDQENSVTSTFENCETSCDASFHNGEDKSSCRQGCEFQIPLSQKRREAMKKMEPSNNPFETLARSGSGAAFRLPTIRIGIPSSFFFGNTDADKEFEEMEKKMESDPFFSQPSGSFPSFERLMPDFSGLFNGMRRHMSGMMDNMMKEADHLENGVVPPNAGRLVVIKSGPGYHSEKTYSFGPEGIKVEAKGADENETVHTADSKKAEQQQDMLNAAKDMLARFNPLERFFSNNDIDIIEPKKETADGNDLTNFVHGYDFEGPRLPDESGIRSRIADNIGRQIYVVEDVCSQNSENMKWSDWVSCLHSRIGLPRWLTAATVSLGIVFIIWLCLAIPHSAPKQKIKVTKAMEIARIIQSDAPSEKLRNGLGDPLGAGALPPPPPAYTLKAQEAAAAVGVTPTPLDTTELPPAYDDVTNLHVAVEVSEGGNTVAVEIKKEAGQESEEKKDEPMA